MLLLSSRKKINNGKIKQFLREPYNLWRILVEVKQELKSWDEKLEERNMIVRLNKSILYSVEVYDSMRKERLKEVYIFKFIAIIAKSTIRERV